jgi:hypothetical protein
VRYRQWTRTNGIYEIVKRGVKRGAKGALPLPQGIYGARILFFVSARTNKRHHHHLITPTPRGEACILATGRRGARERTYVEINRVVLKSHL